MTISLGDSFRLLSPEGFVRARVVNIHAKGNFATLVILNAKRDGVPVVSVSIKILQSVKNGQPNLTLGIYPPNTN